MSPVFRFLGVVLAGYVAVTGLLFFTQRRLMYFPNAEAPDPALSGVAEMTPVRVTTADGLDLLAWYRPAVGGDKPTLVYFHGNAGSLGVRADKVRPFLDAGYGVLLLAWRGYSGNPGDPTEEGLYHDGRGALGFLDEAGVPPSRTVLYGESLGGGVAVQMATERAVAAVVLEAPFSSAVDIAAHHYWYVPARYLVLDRFESKSKIARIGAPLLIVHGERDRVVPVRFGRELLAAAIEPKEAAFFPNADHNDLYDHGAAQAVIEFLERTLQ